VVRRCSRHMWELAGTAGHEKIERLKVRGQTMALRKSAYDMWELAGTHGTVAEMALISVVTAFSSLLVYYIFILFHTNREYFLLFRTTGTKGEGRSMNNGCRMINGKFHSRYRTSGTWDFGHLSRRNFARRRDRPVKLPVSASFGILEG
jgi:hypothetical protein